MLDHRLRRAIGHPIPVFVLKNHQIHTRGFSGFHGKCSMEYKYLISGSDYTPWIIDHRGGVDSGGAGGVSSAGVSFADLGDEEIDAYVATGEPLRVAGAFTIDSLGSAFITGVDGDPHAVV